VNRADPGTGEHRDRGVRDHRQIQRDPIAPDHALALEDVGKAADAVVELLIGDVLVTLRVVTFPEQGDLIATLIEMAVDAVVADVQGAVVIPADVQIVQREGNIPDLAVGSDPVDALADLAPERLRIFKCPALQLLQPGGIDMSRCGNGIEHRVWGEL